VILLREFLRLRDDRGYADIGGIVYLLLLVIVVIVLLKVLVGVA
jgi:hypothetical protein